MDNVTIFLQIRCNSLNGRENKINRVKIGKYYSDLTQDRKAFISHNFPSLLRNSGCLLPVHVFIDTR